MSNATGKMRYIFGMYAPKSDTRLGLESRLHTAQEQSRQLYDFLYAFSDHFGPDGRTPQTLSRLRAAYDAIYPECKTHAAGQPCPCPWTDTGWNINKIKV